jgi:hypothetical protein
VLIRKSGLNSPAGWQLKEMILAPLQRHGVVPVRTYGPRSAAAEVKHSLQRYGIKPDGIINFFSNEPPVKQGAA